MTWFKLSMFMSSLQAAVSIYLKYCFIHHFIKVSHAYFKLINIIVENQDLQYLDQVACETRTSIFDIFCYFQVLSTGCDQYTGHNDCQVSHSFQY